MSQSEWSLPKFGVRAFRYEGAALQKHWSRLHEGDREPYPTADELERMLRESAAPGAKRGRPDVAKLSLKLQEAWRLYHQGDYQAAARLARTLGVCGTVVACKATTVYATHLEANDAARRALLRAAISAASDARGVLPSAVNTHYQYAYALGRSAQSTSILEALAQGIGSKVKEALDRVLVLEPSHADAHAACGTWHAEIVNKVGKLVASLTYAASADKAIEHYRRAIKLAPSSPIARIEYAKGLLLLASEERRKDIRRLYREASQIKPADAMERLDTEFAAEVLASSAQ